MILRPHQTWKFAPFLLKSALDLQRLTTAYWLTHCPFEAGHETWGFGAGGGGGSMQVPACPAHTYTLPG